jgi:methionyl-tRNA synthetase
MSAGVALPKRVFGHGFLYNRGEKMSKSVGNVVDPFVLVGDYGVDQLRYFLLREVPFGQDGNYSREGIVQRINADLANDFGNLAQRSLSMIAKNCGGVVPEPGEFTEADKTILAAADALLARVTQAIDDFAIHRALEIVWAVIADANRYFAGEEPWAHKKTNPKRMETILYVTAEVVRQIGILVQPVMPGSAGKLLDQLGVPRDARRFADLGPAGRLKPGTQLPAPEPVFPRHVDPDSEAAAS